MKKKIGKIGITTLLSIVFVVFVWMEIGKVVNAAPAIGRGGGESAKLFTLQDGWFEAGTFTGSTTTPNQVNRTAALFVADPCNVAFEVKSGWNGVRIRLSSTTDGDSTVTDVFFRQGESAQTAAANGFHFTRIATLTWTTGTQTGTKSGEEFADTVAESNAQWHKTGSAVSPTGNYIAEYSIDALGAGTIGFSPTTQTNDATIYVTGY